MADRIDANSPCLPFGDRVQINNKMVDNTDAIMLPTPASGDEKFVMICLSGPIKIIVPVDKAAVKEQQSGSHAEAIMTPASTHADEALTEEVGPDDKTVSSLCPYIVGGKVLLKITENDARIEAIILEYFPATLSCVMVVRFLDPPVYNNVSKCVLKLYDRRFSTQLRSDEKAAPWTHEVGRMYQDFTADGDAAEFFGYWDAEKATNPYWSGDFVGTRNKWSQAKVEAYLQWMSTSTYETEKKAYELMADLQGDVVPKVLGAVVLDMAVDAQDNADAHSIMSDDSEHNPHISSCPGLLLQHVEGFELTDLATNTAREHWQTTVDSAIITLRHVQNCGILNRDVKTRSFIVDPTTHKVMMLDFGLVFFRDQIKNSREWESSQAVEDEEGAVGLTMYSKLDEEAGGGYIYRPSELALKLSYRFNDEEGEKEGGTEEEAEYLKKRLGQPWDYNPDEE